MTRTTSSNSPPSPLQTPSPPPMECDGYPYPMVPNDIQHEYSFYLPYGSNNGNKNDGQNGSGDGGGGGRGMLACTLYYHPTPTTSSASTTTTTSTPNNNSRESIVNSLKTLDRSIPLIIICHGYASWRNQMLLAFLAGGLYNQKEKKQNQNQKKFHVLRFDFINNGHSHYTTLGNDVAEDHDNICYFSNYQVEYDNLQTIIKFVQQDLICSIACLIGHSKATYNILKYASEQSEQESNLHHIPCFVNLSGRYYIPGTYDLMKRFTKRNIQDELNSNNGQVVVGKCGIRDCVLTKQCLQERNTLDTQAILSKICEKNNDTTTYILTIHGTQDEMIPVQDAYKFDNALPKSNHELCIVEGANHNYNGLKYNKQLVEAIYNFITTKHLQPVEEK